MSLRMAAPDTAKCGIMAVKDAGDVLNDPRSENMKIMVIVNNAADARRLVEQVPAIRTLNVANFGRITDNLAAKPASAIRSMSPRKMSLTSELSLKVASTSNTRSCHLTRLKT